MGTTQTILGLKAETSIHAGTGQNNGVIDLPIQREVHTGYPCVFGSAVKGAFRAHAEVRRKDLNINIKQVFGSASDKGDASNVSFTDARLLLLPVRSLTGHFKLVTCPSILNRLKRDMQMMGQAASWSVPDVQKQQVVGAGNGDIFLEEFKFTQTAGLNDALVAALEQFGAEGLKAQLIIMHDDDFAWFAQNATAVTPHIAIENIDEKTGDLKKIVKDGALWYEESLPSDSLLYTMLMGKTADDVAKVTGMFEGDQRFIQIGGNETVGMGWCSVKEVA